MHISLLLHFLYTWAYAVLLLSLLQINTHCLLVVNRTEHRMRNMESLTSIKKKKRHIPKMLIQSIYEVSMKKKKCLSIYIKGTDTETWPVGSRNTGFLTHGLMFFSITPFVPLSKITEQCLVQQKARVWLWVLYRLQISSIYVHTMTAPY